MPNLSAVPRKQLLIEAREREGRVLDLRKSGASFERIAQAVGFQDRTAAYKAFRRALKRVGNEQEAIEARLLTATRYDEAIFAIWRGVMDGDLAAIDRLVKVESSRHAILFPDRIAFTNAAGDDVYDALSYTEAESLLLGILERAGSQSGLAALAADGADAADADADDAPA